MSKQRVHKAGLNYMIGDISRYQNGTHEFAEEYSDAERNVGRAHTNARTASRRLDRPIGIIGRPNAKLEDYYIEYHNGVPQCPSYLELVPGYKKSDGTYVHPFCRKRKESQEQRMIDTQERGIYEAETDYTGERRRGY